MHFFSSIPPVFLTLPGMSLINQHEVHFMLFLAATGGGSSIIRLSENFKKQLFCAWGEQRYKIRNSNFLVLATALTPRDGDSLKA